MPLAVMEDGYYPRVATLNGQDGAVSAYFATILADPAVSSWLKNALLGLLGRNPREAVDDATRLLEMVATSPEALTTAVLR